MLSSEPWESRSNNDEAELEPAGSRVHSGGLPLEDLRALLAASADPPREPFRDPALEDLVQQACCNTDATAAAIALAHGHEFVCVASTGSNAPDFGSHLNQEYGLSAICLHTREMQRCDDTETDPRVDAEACRQLGVRSVLMVPLLLGEQLVGLFELFSPIAGGFSDRDIDALFALSWRVLDHLAMPSESEFGNPLQLDEIRVSDEQNHVRGEKDDQENEHFHEPPAHETAFASFQPVEEFVEEYVEEEVIEEEPAGESVSGEQPAKVQEGQLPQEDDPSEVLLSLEGDGEESYPEFAAMHSEDKSQWTRILTIAVIVVAIVLGWVLGRGGSKPPAPAPQPAQQEQPSTSPAGDLNTPPEPQPQQATPETIEPAKPEPKAPVASEPPPAQGLVVYKNGKVVFKAASQKPKQPAATPQEEANDVPAVPPAKISPAAAGEYLVKKVEPEYPAEARQKRVQGPVVLQAVVDDEGQVQQLTVLSGDSRLVAAAMDAVRHWQFKPYAPNGEPTQFETQITVNFTLPASQATENQ